MPQEEVEGAYWFGLVCASVTFCIWPRTVRDRILEFNILNKHLKEKRTRFFFFFFVELVIAESCPFFDFCIVNLWNLVNIIFGEPLEVGS